MTRVFKTRHFQRWMRKTELTDAALCKAVDEMAAGLIDADLGAGVVKKRVGLAGRGPEPARNWMKPLPTALCRRFADDHQDPGQEPHP